MASVNQIARFPSPWGPLRAVLEDGVLEELDFGEGSPDPPPADPALRRLGTELERYFRGDLRRFRQPLGLRGTEFQLAVWEALLRIPENANVSYAQVARAIGRPGASRAVGNAIGSNPVAWIIPCHRVIRQLGTIGGYRWGARTKRAMLGYESARTGISPAP